MNFDNVASTELYYLFKTMFCFSSVFNLRQHSLHIMWIFMTPLYIEGAKEMIYLRCHPFICSLGIFFLSSVSWLKHLDCLFIDYVSHVPYCHLKNLVLYLLHIECELNHTNFILDHCCGGRETASMLISLCLSDIKFFNLDLHANIVMWHFCSFH